MNLLTPEEVANLLKIKLRQFKDRVQFQRDFPKPIVLGRNTKRWNSEALEEWIGRNTAPR